MVNPEVRTGEEQTQYVKGINKIIGADDFELVVSGKISNELIYKIYKRQAAKSNMKNLIFAPLGKKPDIVIDDAIANDIKIVGDTDNCLLYDFEPNADGLLWNTLVKWWGSAHASENIQKDLFKRLLDSLDSQPEKDFSTQYYTIYQNANEYPALIPQVYLHYDPHARTWRGKYVDIIDKVRVEVRPLFKDSKDTKVIFGRYLRLNYIFKDPGDIIADNLYTNLTNKFAELRRKRGAITRAELEAVVNSAISKGSIFSGLSLSVGYSKIENGYVENEQKVKKRDLIMAGFKKAKKDIMRGWRKAYRKELIISCIFSAKRCPQCGHPMMANMMGIFGIACPNCGFNPYVTMFIFCECGAYEVVKAQPELEDDKQIQYLKEFFDGRESDVCKVCGKKLIDEYVENRIFYAPIPYPYEEIDNM